MDTLLAAHNGEVVWTDNRHRGYVRIVLERDEGRADYVAVSTVLSHDYQVDTIRRMPLRKRGNHLSFG